MGLEGQIETISLSGILQLLCHEEKTGILKVCNDNVEYQIYFLNGCALYAIESFKAARLGDLLVEDGIISEAVIQDCLKEATHKKIAIGRVLVEKGHVSFKTLESYIYKQILEVIFHMLKWKNGKFSYQDMRYNLRWLVVVKLNTLQLIMDAKKIIDGDGP